MRTFAISDIHGCALTFKALLEKINFSLEDRLYLLGDYIDRGPDSKGVIDLIWELQAQGYSIFCLRGNHEQMMLEAASDHHSLSRWTIHGGKETLDSFGIPFLSGVPKKYIEWLHSLGHYFEVDSYILLHAGLRFEMDDPLQEKNSMLWQRNWYHKIDRKWLNGRIILHGHTPTVTRDIEKSLNQLEILPVLVIDNGCVYKRAGMGQLAAFQLENRQLHFQPRLD